MPAQSRAEGSLGTLPTALKEQPPPDFSDFELSRVSISSHSDIDQVTCRLFPCIVASDHKLLYQVLLVLHGPRNALDGNIREIFEELGHTVTSQEQAKASAGQRSLAHVAESVRFHVGSRAVPPCAGGKKR